MKKNILLFILLTITVLSGCTSSGSDPDPELTPSLTSIDLESEGGNKTIKITSNTSWTIHSNQSWCTPEKSSGTGTETISVQIDPNPGFTPRTATVTISGDGPNLTYTIPVNQKAKERTLDITPGSLSFKQGGGEGTFAITCNDDWTITGMNEWCSVSAERGKGDAVITVTVSENPDYDPRNLELTVTSDKLSKTIGIDQYSRTLLEIDTENLSFEKDGEEKIFSIACNDDWTISGMNEWCGVSAERGEGNAVITVTVSENPGYEPRHLELAVTSGDIIRTIGIDQASQILLEVNPEFLDFGKEGEEKTFFIVSGGDWTITGMNSWCSVNTDKGRGNAEITVKTIENPGYDPKELELTITSGEFFRTVGIRQAPQVLLEVNPEELEFEREGGSKTFAITGNGEWTITGVAGWCSVSPLSGNGSSTVQVTVAPNSGMQSLNSTWTVTSGDKIKTVEITSHGEIDYALQIPDENFRAYCLRYFDTDKDGKLSKAEIEKVQQISLSFDSNVSDLTGIKLFVNLTYFYCNSNPVSQLDVSGMKALKEITCTSNQLTALNVSGCTSLTTIDCSYNKITNLDLGSSMPKLTTLKCFKNQLTLLDLSGCPALTSIDCSYNQISELNLGYSLTRLTTLRCNDNQLEELSLSGCVALINLYADKNRLQELDLKELPKLKTLSCQDNPNLYVIYLHQDANTTLSIPQETSVVKPGPEKNPDEYEVGDLYPNAENPIGIVFLLEPGSQGLHGKITSLDEVPGLRWANSLGITGATSWSDGKANVAKIRSLGISNYPAFKWCADKGSEWRLPSGTELGVIKEYRSLLNLNLSKVPGAVLLHVNDYYWASSERSQNSAESLLFTAGTVCTQPKTSEKSNIHTRAVMEF